MMPPCSCAVPGQVTADVGEGDDRDVEAVAEAHEARGLERRGDVERAGEVQRLVGDDADGAAGQARQADDDVLRVVGVDLQEVGAVDDAVDHLANVVGLRLVLGQDGQHLFVAASGVVAHLDDGRVVHVVQRQVSDEAPHLVEAVLLGIEGEVGDAGARGVHAGAAEVLVRDLFHRDGLHDVRAGDEHVAVVLDHEDEVGDRGRVDGAAGSRAHDHGDLGHDAGCADVAAEDLAVALEAGDAFLDARAAAVVDADDRHAGLDREVHDLADLLGGDLGHAAADDREVLREDTDRAAPRSWRSR